VYGYTPVHSGWMYSQGLSGTAEDAVEIQFYDAAARARVTQVAPEPEEGTR